MTPSNCLSISRCHGRKNHCWKCSGSEGSVAWAWQPFHTASASARYCSGSEEMSSAFFFADKSHREAGKPLIQWVYHQKFQECWSYSGNVLMISTACAYFASITWPWGLLTL